MFLASGLIHLVVLLLVSQLVLLPGRAARQKNILAHLRMTRRKEPDLVVELLTAIREQKQPETESPPAEKETPPQPTPEDRKDAPPADAKFVEIDIPDLAAPTLVMSPGDGNRRPGLSSRSPGGKRTALEMHGGSARSERAVKAALGWLMRHQHPGGMWSGTNFTRNCRHDHCCGGWGTNAGIDAGLSGLALLAFLSSGHYQDDGTKFGRTVAGGIRYLLRAQDPSGRIGGASAHEMYNHSIATLAIAEAYILSGDKSLREPLQRAVDYIIGAQQREGGWDYRARRTGRNDTSITGFVVMALKSASAAGVGVPWMVTYGMIQHFDSMTRDSAEVIYADRGVGAGRAGIGMVAVGALSRQFLGWPVDSPVLRRQYQLMRRNPPRWELLSNDAYHNTYYWYYGTLAMFQAGGEDWKSWNAHLRDMLVMHQRNDGCARGSWDPVGKWLGKAGGRVYSTAINAMNLQVYYRYLPVYEAPALNSLEALVRASSATGDMRIRAIRILGQFRDRQSTETLVKSLGDHDPFVRFNAAAALLEQGETQRALPVLIDLSRHTNGFIRYRAVDELVKRDALELIPVFIERLNDRQDFVATKAARKLRRLCKKNFNFDPSAAGDDKDRAVAAWREWYMKYKAGEVQIDRSLVFGSVINVRPEVVMLNVGERDAVEPGDDFDVIQGGRVVARVKVFRVLKQFCAARIVQAEAEEPVRQGDTVKKITPRS